MACWIEKQKYYMRYRIDACPEIVNDLPQTYITNLKRKNTEGLEQAWPSDLAPDYNFFVCLALHKWQTANYSILFPVSYFLVLMQDIEVLNHILEFYKSNIIKHSIIHSSGICTIFLEVLQWKDNRYFLFLYGIRQSVMKILSTNIMNCTDFQQHVTIF